MNPQVAVVFAVCVAAAVVDVRTGRIPNALTVPFWIAGLAVAAALGAPDIPGPAQIGFGEACSVSLATLLLGYLVYAFGSVGGGDVKLLVGVAAWTGFPAIVEILVFSITSALLMVLVMNVVRGRLWVFTRTAFAMGGSFLFPALRAYVDEDVVKERLPLGVAIFLGVCTWFAVLQLNAVT